VIDLAVARELIDLAARIHDPERAEEQLRGAVALHHWLETHKVAYLADEVGLGKTYVALATIALFRHFDPDFRVLVIAPKENIQRKWCEREWPNFVRHNVRFADLRVRGLDGRPVRPAVMCHDLGALVREATVDPNRDFFARLTSFSLAYNEGKEDDYVMKLQNILPWVRREHFRLDALPVYRGQFKDDIARVINSALPEFDLVIIDEGHNLKHGYGAGVASRNRVLGQVLGHSRRDDSAPLPPGYGPRAKRVLFLSATPTDVGYGQIWNQLDVVDKAGEFAALRAPDVKSLDKQDLLRNILLRRVNTVCGQTKNQYRREWRRGGLLDHDRPITVQSDRQRLVVALMQKKVSELLGDARFGSSFQIGMLASFESFLQTAKVAAKGPSAGLDPADMPSAFDDAEQTDDDLERQGVDVHHVNHLAHSYRETFGDELPHPKMDAAIERLARVWDTGEKHLVFVRRVASVTELKRKLDDVYDAWLIERLAKILPNLERELRQQARGHHEIKLARRRRSDDTQPAAADVATERPGEDKDKGGGDTFFSWFFRGEGPADVVSGAAIQQQFVKPGSRLALFFARNHVAELLGVPPGRVHSALADALDLDLPAAREVLQDRARYFVGEARRPPRKVRFEAAQAAGVQLLANASGPWQPEAQALWHERYQGGEQKQATADVADAADLLELETFFTELRLRPSLCAALWPEPRVQELAVRVRERELRAELLASAARLGHAFIHLYAIVVQPRSSLAGGVAMTPDDVDSDDHELASIIRRYLDELSRQRVEVASAHTWGAYGELRSIAEHFELIIDVNLADVRDKPLVELTKKLGTMLGRQQPVGGMSGTVNRTLVGQFRMPGYPLVLVSTDLLQEGEDLHTFCSSVHHYGLSWTPSSMEQRIGRIDRVRSAADRQMAKKMGLATPDDQLQVFYPHLQDTVEVLQVQEVLRRMDDFLRLMHQGLDQPNNAHDKRIDIQRALAANLDYPEPIRKKLETAFPLPEPWPAATISTLAVSPQRAIALLLRFHLAADQLPAQWDGDVDTSKAVRYGTLPVGHRKQPFTLRMLTLGERPMVRCTSPVGKLAASHSSNLAQVMTTARIGVVDGGEQYDVTVEDDVVLTDAAHDVQRVVWLVLRVVRRADTIELEHLGTDLELGHFKDQLAKEAQNA
jgi:hypothetical protein